MIINMSTLCVYLCILNLSVSNSGNLFASIFCAFYTQIFCNNSLPLFSSLVLNLVFVLFFDIRLIFYSIKCLFLHKKLVIEGINYGVAKSDFSEKMNKLLWLTQKAFF